MERVVQMFDTECYADYWLLSIMDYDTGTIHHFDLYPGGPDLPVKKIMRLFSNDTIVGFNIANYDLPLVVSALLGKNNTYLKNLSDKIIKSSMASWQIAKDFDITVPQKWDYIDLFSIPPGKASLKAYGARLGAPKLQDLPFEPDSKIAIEQHALVKSYCENDLRLTKTLYDALQPEIHLRETMTKEYGVDVRSKSDAQIAETIIKSELKKLTGKEYRKQDPSKLLTSFYMKSPLFVTFSNDLLNDIYFRLLKDPFAINSAGRIDLPKWLKDVDIVIGNTAYGMGIGGLHSKEKSQFLCAENGYHISDLDVVSYYPSIILQQGVVPKSLGKAFLSVYQGLVLRRIEAKKAGDIGTANTLKIAVNGSYGKLGSIYSFLYAPEILIQTTITGQLALLMLIERMENSGIQVRSANTDGIVCYYHEDQTDLLHRIVDEWQRTTAFELEQANYRILASRDVNNYCAITMEGKVKMKGIFAPSYYAAEKPTQFHLAKNPDRYIIPLSVIGYLKDGRPIEDTVRSCTDVRHFVSVTKVTGGAVWRGAPVGKTIRFYNSTDIPEDEAILYAVNGNRVGTTGGCRPLMDLPEGNLVPGDVNYDFYIGEAYKLLEATGAPHA